MFYGRAEHSIDIKGRIILPSKYRDNLGESFFIMPGFEKCLAVYTEEGFRKLEEKLLALPSSNDGGWLQRELFNDTEQVSADKQGRFVVPTFLREFANLKKDIMIAGASDRIEIWDLEEYKAYKERYRSNPRKLPETLGAFNL